MVWNKNVFKNKIKKYSLPDTIAVGCLLIVVFMMFASCCACCCKPTYTDRIVSSEEKSKFISFRRRSLIVSFLTLFLIAFSQYGNEKLSLLLLFQ